ncbi:mpv17-like protein 2 [Cydia splendana]|uniref:mpv17-like protein 2 n=1 Tax=Cydia splendana TaxID=1100963 RepID=UPI002132FA7C
MAIRRAFSHAYKSVKQARRAAFSRKNLFYTNVLISIGISTMGDMLEQSYEVYRKKIPGYDLNRTAQMGFSGATAGVICHHWYNILDRIIIGRSLDMVIKKLMLDQFVSSPIIILSFFATVAIFEENPWENFTDEVRDKFLILYKAEWVVWPPAQIINFYFLPTKYRVLYDNTISLGYDIYTSKVKHDKSLKKERDKE